MRNRWHEEIVKRCVTPIPTLKHDLTNGSKPIIPVSVAVTKDKNSMWGIADTTGTGDDCMEVALLPGLATISHDSGDAFLLSRFGSGRGSCERMWPSLG
jgi:hypothetical protein